MDFRGVAHELIQFRKGKCPVGIVYFTYRAPELSKNVGLPGHNIGKPTGRGVKVVGTQEAMRTELVETLESLRGAKGDLMREKAKSLGKEIEADQVEGGKSFEMLMKIGTLG